MTERPPTWATRALARDFAEMCDAAAKRTQSPERAAEYRANAKQWRHWATVLA